MKHSCRWLLFEQHLFVPKHVTLSQKMRLALLVSIPLVFSSFLHGWPYWHQVSYFHACRGQICQSQLVPVSSPGVLELNFLKGVSLIFSQAGSNKYHEWSTWQPLSLEYRAAGLVVADSMWRYASQCLWCPVGIIHAKHAVLQRTSVTTTSMSLRPKVQLLQLKLCMIDTCQTSWALATRIMEAVWTMILVPFQVGDPVWCGTFGTRCGERKRSVFDRGGITWLWKTACYRVCLVLLFETVAPKLFLLKYSDSRWFLTKGSLFMFIQRKHNWLEYYSNILYYMINLIDLDPILNSFGWRSVEGFRWKSVLRWFRWRTKSSRVD